MLAEEIIPGEKFTEPQLELLKMFSRKYPDKVWIEIKDILSSYFLEKATQEMDELFKQKNWGKEKVKEWANTHMRTHYDKND
jgi:hypothetical protein